MSEPFVANLKTVGYYCLAGFFFATTFSLFLAQWYLGLATFAALVVFFANGEYRRFSRLEPAYKLILLFIGWEIFSSLVDPTPVKSLLITKKEWLFVMIPTAAYLIDSERKLKWTLAIFAVSAILLSLYAVIQHFAGIDLYHHATLPPAPSSGFRVQGTFSNRMTFGNYFAVAAVFLMGIAPYSVNQKLKTLFYAGFGLSALAMFFSYGRGPIAALCGGVIAYLVMMSRKYVKTALLLVLAVVIIIVVASPDILTRYFSSTSSLETEWEGKYAGSRLAIWRAAGRMIQDHPVFGVGHGNFVDEYPIYRDTGTDRVYTHAHNDLINISAYTGIPAAIFYIGFWVAFIAGMIRLLRNRRTTGLLRGAATGALLASIVFFVTSLYEATFADEEVRLLLMAIWGVFLAAVGIVKRYNPTADEV